MLSSPPLHRLFAVAQSRRTAASQCTGLRCLTVPILLQCPHRPLLVAAVGSGFHWCRFCLRSGARVATGLTPVASRCHGRLCWLPSCLAPRGVVVHHIRLYAGLSYRRVSGSLIAIGENVISYR